MFLIDDSVGILHQLVPALVSACVVHSSLITMKLQTQVSPPSPQVLSIYQPPVSLSLSRHHFLESFSSLAISSTNRQHHEDNLCVCNSHTLWGTCINSETSYLHHHSHVHEYNLEVWIRRHHALVQPVIFLMYLHVSDYTSTTMEVCCWF